jgi:enoyl-CoA hydratase/carnithine racemase
MSIASIAPKTFRYECASSGVAQITLDREDKLNSLTFDVYRELADVMDQLNAHDEVRAIVITGAGRAFCSGGDVSDIIGELFARDIEGLVDFTRITGKLIGSIRKVRRPVIAAVNGVAVGAGAVIALACDFRIASEKAKFGFIFPQVGLCGADMGAGYLLPRVVGLGRATELLFTGDIIDASRALSIGLVNTVETAEKCVETARKLAERLASGPAFAHSMTKQMLESEHTMSLDEALEAEAQAQAICMAHSDFRTAFDAWTEKRAPRFAGATIDFIKQERAK